MIDSIELHDFKSHKDTLVKFHRGVNVFVGLSDNGKTNIVRAINWVANNRPLGDGVINRDSTGASVRMTVSHAKGNKTDTIRRTKGKNSNEYSINDGQSFTAFGSDPPAEIKQALNLSEINLQRQFEPYFLVFDSPGQVATFIRSITKLDEIDLVIGDISRQIKQNKIDVEVCQNERADVLTRLDVMARVDLDGMQTRIDRTRHIIGDNGKTNEIIGKMIGLVEQIDAIKPIEIPDDLDERFDKIGRLIELITIRRADISGMTMVVNQIKSIKTVTLPHDLNAKLDCIKQKIDESERLQYNVSRLNEIIRSIRATESDTTQLSDLVGMLDRLAHLHREYNENVEKHDRLFTLISQIQKATSDNDLNLTDQKSMEREIDDLRDQLTTCPTCGSDLDEERKERLLHG